MLLRVAGIVKESVVDGPGVRVVVFTQGCPRHCKGCHNPKLIPLEGGTEMKPEQVVDLVEQSVTPLTRGITFSGGDPLLQHEALCEVLKLLRARFPGLDVWVYTGYLFEEIKELPVIKYIDVLVDGPFELDKKDPSLQFRGSSNQRIFRIKRD